MTPKVPSFETLLDSARVSALHLEMRDTYAVAEEADDLALWRSGKWSLEDGRRTLGDWLALVRRTVGRGVDVRRARIVSQPVSEYIRYEHALTPLNLEAGEGVRWLPRREALGIALSANDFWLIDATLVRFNHFTGEGEAAEPEMNESPSVARLCATAFDEVWERGIVHHEFAI
ncbi:DUF6879 family protein [Streptomyces sp. NPDC049879]|uniref:DUF6879 family protein n=1 Tax=Streptomyces sp. NPDC049879 TaxID=3365598 RepID=UPI003797C2E1